ncbi:hypothetical protein F4779DRAFT_601707 [Xylariaceae sp. FL0662B]|nr:hypothetical protein F4779DRAFT_601707 [Xylariaceae sp. FL0662B]
MATLPLELAHNVIALASVSREELKSLRLVCRSWNVEATRLLFRRVCLSRLKSDYDNFFNIAAHPHLARAVQVIVWQELGDMCQPFNVIRPLRFEKRNTDFAASEEGCELDKLRRDIDNQVQNIFWIPGLPSRPEDRFQDEALKEFKGKLRTIIRDFREKFAAASEAMPNLHTMVSQPMSPYRELTGSNGGYPLTAQVLQSKLGVNGGNSAFRYFVIPEMARRYSEKKTPITRLQFADERYRSAIHTFYSPEDVYKQAFASLTHIDVCISHRHVGTEIYQLKACIKAAKALTHLRLCFERGHPGYAFDFMFEHLRIPSLCSLYLEDMTISSELLVDFVAKHAGSLKNLRIDADVPIAAVNGLAQNPSITLDSFTAIPRNDPFVASSEHEVLDFINNGPSPAAFQDHDEEPDEEKVFVSTTPAIYDIHGWSTAAICDSRRADALDLGYDAFDLFILDEDNGDVRHKHEIEPAEDTIPSRSSSSSSSTGDDEDMMQDAGDFNPREHASQLARERESPRWQWGCSDSRDEDEYDPVTYWRVHAPHGVRTTMWRFAHRNGEVAYGGDPLEFWEDWEGSEAGDTAEATPFGSRFEAFVTGQAEAGAQVGAPQAPCDGTYVPYYDEDDLWREYCDCELLRW